MNALTRCCCLLATVTVLYAPLSVGHSNHNHGPINAEQAVGLASGALRKMTEVDAQLGFGKLDPSWLRLPDTAMQVDKKSNGFFIVSLEHPEEQRRIFILMSEKGEVFDANFTGKFDGLD